MNAFIIFLELAVILLLFVAGALLLFRTSDVLAWQIRMMNRPSRELEQKSPFMLMRCIGGLSLLFGIAALAGRIFPSAP